MDFGVLGVFYIKLLFQMFYEIQYNFPYIWTYLEKLSFFENVENLKLSSMIFERLRLIILFKRFLVV